MKANDKKILKELLEAMGSIEDQIETMDLDVAKFLKEDPKLKMNDFYLCLLKTSKNLSKLIEADIEIYREEDEAVMDLFEGEQL